MKMSSHGSGLPFLNTFASVRTMLLIFLFIFTNVNATEPSTLFTTLTPANCPVPCECIQSHNTEEINVKCNDHDLESVPENVLSINIEELDLSNNYIFSLTESSFRSYSSIRVLILHFTRINSMEDNVFRYLENVKEIDLSFNHITGFSNTLFIHLTELEILFLRNNPLALLDTTVPIIKSFSIKKLDLSYCKLTFINENTFRLLFALEKLNIRSNRLKVIKLDYFVRLAHIVEVDIYNNPWDCTCELQMIVEWMKRRASGELIKTTDITVAQDLKSPNTPMRCVAFGKFRNLQSECGNNEVSLDIPSTVTDQVTTNYTNIIMIENNLTTEFLSNQKVNDRETSINMKPKSHANKYFLTDTDIIIIIFMSLLFSASVILVHFILKIARKQNHTHVSQSEAGKFLEEKAL